MKYLKSYNESFFDVPKNIDSEFKNSCMDYLSDLEDYNITFQTFDWFGGQQGMVNILPKNKITIRIGDIKGDITRLVGVTNFELSEVVTSINKSDNVEVGQSYDRMEDIPDDLYVSSIQIYFNLLPGWGSTKNESFNDTEISLIHPEDNDDVIDILSEVFGIIDDRETIKSKIAKRLNNDLSIKIEMNGKIVGCYLLAEKSINLFYSQIENNELKDFPKDETKILTDKNFSDNGIQGISLAILPQYKGQGIGKQLKEYVSGLGYDYVWGVQDKKLKNIDFWTKSRSIFVESKTHYATVEIS